MKPKFKVGDRIQCGGAPSVVLQVRNVNDQSYDLAPPNEAEDWVSLKHSVVDTSYRKNAREFNRQVKQHNKPPVVPGFDEKGMPTFEEDRDL